MVDVLSTRLHAIYNTWDRLPQADNTLSPFVRRQVAQKRKEREDAKIRQRNDEKEILNSKLTKLKKEPWFGFPRQPIRQLIGHCHSCATNLLTSRDVAAEKQQDVIDVLEIEETQSDNIFVRTFCYLVHNFRIPNYNFIAIRDTVLTDDRVQDAISESTSEVLSVAPDADHTADMYRQILAKQTRKAKRVIEDMSSALSNVMLKILSYLLYKLLPRFMTSISVHPSQIEMMKRAAATNLPIILVPLHRSHLDYVLIIFILYNNNIRPPLTAAGINLKIPIFGILLRWLGAFYIKRRIEPSSGAKDVIYRSALHTYMVQCLKAGHNMKFYIEGGRTRTGKPGLPKVGLLSVIVDAYMDGAVEDALLVPVSANYDKLVDGNFICELLGQPKQKETFTGAVSAIWTTLNSSHGACRVDFGQPFSLRDLVKSYQSSIKPSPIEIPLIVPPVSKPPDGTIQSTASLSSLHGTDVVKEDYRYLVEHIANHLVFDSTAACAVMSTNMVAFLLLNKFRSGVKLGQLVNIFDQLRNNLTSTDKELGFTGASVDVVNSALSLLGPGLVKKERKEGESEWDELITPITMLPNVIELSYYGNALTPHYARRSIIATSVFAMLKCKTDLKLNDVELKQKDLIQHSLELCEILQFEFLLYKPCEQLEDVLSSTLDDFTIKDLLPLTASTTQTIATQRKRVTLGYEDDDDEYRYQPTESLKSHKVNTREEALDELRLYSMTLRPLLDTYIATVMGLHGLVGRQITETQFAKEIIEEIKGHLATGYCLYAESCAVDSIKNACKVLLKWGVLETFTKDSVKLIYLSDAYNNKSAVKDLATRLQIYKYSDAL